MTKKDFLPTYDAEELELMRELAQGERTPIKDLNSEKKRQARYAKNTIEKANKRKAISIRIFEEDLIKIKAKAQDLGIPYQTYISSELRKLVAQPPFSSYQKTDQHSKYRTVFISQRKNQLQKKLPHHRESLFKIQQQS